MISAICVLFCLAGASAQELTNPYLIPFKDKLPGSHVYSMVKDSMGYLWIGTDNGLARYDGTRIRIFRPAADSGSVGGSTVTSIIVENDHLWCSHNNGISRLDLNNYTFRHYYFEIHNENFRMRFDRPQDVMAILRLQDGTLCAGLRYDGFVKYDASQDTFIRIRPPVEITRPRNDAYWSADHILSMVEDKFEAGVVWIGTLAGILKLDIEKEHYDLFRWAQEDASWETNFNSVRKIVQLPNGQICWGTWYAGVHVMDPSTRTYSRLPNSENDAGIMTTTTTKLTLVGDTTLWVSTGLGVCSYDLVHEEISSIWTNNYARNEIYGFDYVDDDGRVYGNTIEGISVYDPLLQQFKAYSFAGMDPSRRGMAFDTYFDKASGKFLVGVRSEGFYTFEPALNKWERIELPSGIDSRLLGNLKPTHSVSHEYFVQSGNHILIYDTRSGKFKKERYNVDLPSSGIIDILEDHRGMIWVSTARDGYFILNRQTGAFTRFSTPGAHTQAAGERGVFYLDSNKRIWMKKRQSYHVYSPVDNRLYDFMDSRISMPYRQAFAEMDGYMYITSGGKLLRHSVDSFMYEVLDTVDIDIGFPSVRPGVEGVIWGASDKRLYKYDTRRHEARSFSFEYGTSPQQVFTFSVAHDGRVILGDFERIIVVNPSELRSNTVVPIPYVSQVQVGDRVIYPSLHWDKKRPVRLKHTEDFFSLDISSISYVMSDYNRFKYRLRDLKEEWTDIAGAQTINFTNVPSGDYTFELMAANNEGIWNENLYTLPVSVATPWFNTAIAKVSGVILLLALAFLAYRYRVSQIRKEERLTTQFERQLADVEMSALRAQMNPHFIFNCLNSIENFVIKNDTFRASTYLHDFSRLIRLILQNSRSKYIPLKDELEALELYLEMESLRFTNKFEYEIMVEPEVEVNHLEVPPMIIQPYVENAIWHGLIPKGQPGRLVVHVSRQNGVLNCSIEDNGIGREHSMEINKKRKHDKPKSMGMAITSERISILNRLYKTNTTIEIIDKKDGSGNPSGTRVELNIPVE